MDHNENQPSYVTISIKTLWNILRRCWYWMLAGAIVVGVTVYCLYRFLLYTPTYSSTSIFYLPNISESTYLYSGAQIQGAESMAESITKLVRADALTEKIKYDTGYENVKGFISASSDGATLRVTVSGWNPDKNYDIAHSIEKWLPIYCDYYNNQFKEDDTPDSIKNPYSYETKTMKLVYAAVKDESPDNYSNLTRYPMLAAFFVAMIIYVIFLIVDITNTTIYSSEDLKFKAPKYSIIGTISHWALDGEKKGRNRLRKDEFRINVDQKILLRDHVPFRISEAFHELRTNITFCAAGEKGCTIGVISSVAGSGKSFVMANLAVSLSKLFDKKILLIDADMRCPMIHKIFSLPNKKGLSNLIANQVADDADVKNTFGNLDVITSGTLPPNPIDLLSCPRMIELMEQWKQTYDYILVDLPPIGEVSDAFAISSLISGYMVVVRSGYMDSRLLRDTVEVVESKNAKIYGYVITDVHPEHSEGYSYSKYGHYYKYKYSRYGKYHYYHRYYSEAERAEQAKQAEEDEKAEQAAREPAEQIDAEKQD